MICQTLKRSNFGVIPKTMIRSDVLKRQCLRSPLEVYKLSLGLENNIEQKDNMSGDGIFDKIKSLMSMGDSAKTAVQKLGGIWTGDIGTSLRNMVPSSDSNARPQFPGEMHAILKLPNGKYGTANFAGPGTHLEARLRRGDPPRTPVDGVALIHDSQYALAKSQKDVAKADRRMIKKLKAMQKSGRDNKYNIQLGMKPIQAKLRAEQLGIVKPGTIATFGDAKDRALIKRSVAKAKQEGYGLGLPGGGADVMLPGDRLKIKMLRKASRKKKKTKGGALKLAGQGLRLGGQGLTKDMAKFAISKLLPILLTKLRKAGIPIPKQKGGALVSHKKLQNALSNVTGIKNATLSKAVKKYAKVGAMHLLPVILKMVQAKMKGSGMKDKLNTSLMTALMRGFKWFLNKRRPSGTPELFSGSGMCGKGFWSDFGKGFTGVFKTAYKYGKPLAPLVPLLL